MTQTDYISDAQIEQALDQHDDRDHPDALSVDDVRSLLAALATDVTVRWSEYMDQIERGDSLLVAETDALLVVDTGQIVQYNEALQQLDDQDVLEVEYDDIARNVVSSVMHQIAGEHSDRDWGVSYPMILPKPAEFDAGQAYVDAVINGLCRRGCSPGQAWAYYGVEIRGESQSAWSRRMGYKDPSSVAKPLKKARQTLQG